MNNVEKTPFSSSKETELLFRQIDTGTYPIFSECNTFHIYPWGLSKISEFLWKVVVFSKSEPKKQQIYDVEGSINDVYNWCSNLKVS